MGPRLFLCLVIMSSEHCARQIMADQECIHASRAESSAVFSLPLTVVFNQQQSSILLWVMVRRSLARVFYLELWLNNQRSFLVRILHTKKCADTSAVSGFLAHILQSRLDDDTVMGEAHWTSTWSISRMHSRIARRAQSDPVELLLLHQSRHHFDYGNMRSISSFGAMVE